jgi:hypothetical protein
MQRMKRRWFKAWGWIYRPVSWQGFLVVLAGLAFTFQAFMAVDARSHSISDTLYGIFPYTVITWMLVYWVATKTVDDGR